MQMFIRKNIRKKVVKPLKNSVKAWNLYHSTDEKDVKIVHDEPISAEPEVKKKNKREKKNKEMVNENKLAHIEEISGVNIPEMNVKIEKTERGLYERTENSTILLTEDNKMLLND